MSRASTERARRSRSRRCAAIAGAVALFVCAIACPDWFSAECAPERTAELSMPRAEGFDLAPVRSPAASRAVQGGAASERERGVAESARTVRSRIVSAATGNPVRATIRVKPGTITTTQRSGAFELLLGDDPDGRDVKLAIAADGYHPRAIETSADALPKRIELDPLHAMSLRVVDGAGAPVPHAQIVLWPLEEHADPEDWMRRAENVIVCEMGPPSEHRRSAVQGAPLARFLACDEAGAAELPLAGACIAYACSDAAVSPLVVLEPEAPVLTLVLDRERGTLVELVEFRSGRALPGRQLAIERLDSPRALFRMECGEAGRLAVPLPAGSYLFECAHGRGTLVEGARDVEHPRFSAQHGASLSSAIPVLTLAVETLIGSRAFRAVDARSGEPILSCTVGFMMMPEAGALRGTIFRHPSTSQDGTHALGFHQDGTIRTKNEHWISRMGLSIVAEGYRALCIDDLGRVFGTEEMPTLALEPLPSPCRLTVAYASGAPYRGLLRIRRVRDHVVLYEGWVDDAKPVLVDRTPGALHVEMGLAGWGEGASLEVDPGDRASLRVVLPARGRIVVRDVPAELGGALACADRIGTTYGVCYRDGELVTTALPAGEYWIAREAQLESMPFTWKRSGAGRSIAVAEDETSFVHWSDIAIPELDATGVLTEAIPGERARIQVMPRYRGSDYEKQWLSWPDPRFTVPVDLDGRFHFAALCEAPAVLDFFAAEGAGPLRCVGRLPFAGPTGSYPLKVGRLVAVRQLDDEAPQSKFAGRVVPKGREGGPDEWPGNHVPGAGMDYGLLAEGRYVLSLHAGDGEWLSFDVEVRGGEMTRVRITRQGLVALD